MAVHPDGTGTGWTNVETVDVDQPHGKDYLYSQHIAKGVRKRINKEHVAFGDSTAGGEHVPGGCNVLDVVDSTADLTDGWNDGTYVGGGLVHETDKGRLWVCSTLDTTYDGATDVTLVKLHPDLQWASQDVTWAGAHEFDASVDISGNVAMDGDLTIDGSLKVGTDFSLTGDMAVDGSSNLGGAAAIGGDVSVAGKLVVDSSCDVSDVYVDGDISVKGSLDVATDLSVSGDMAVDGTSNWGGDAALGGDLSIAGKLIVDSSCDVSDVYVDGDMSVKGSLDVATDLSVTGDIAVDGTAAKFGGTVGIGLFYDPTDYDAAQESITFPNGLIMKHGFEAQAGVDDAVAFGVAFPTGLISVTIAIHNPTSQSMTEGPSVIDTETVNGFAIHQTDQSPAGHYWQAWGY